MNTQLKLKFYYDHVLSTVYSEGESPFHRTITTDVVTRFIDPLDLPKHSVILDLGCGPGYFLDEMGQRGFTNVQGISLSAADIEICSAKGHKNLSRSDMNFLSAKDESVDLLFCRHSLEHSPFPYITLIEYNRVLKPRGVLYVEVPAPDCELRHETNRNHYSVLGRSMWLSLLERTGFDVAWHDYEFPVRFEDHRGTVQERYHIFVCRRRRPMDIK
jgi:SAM-dependent methyltransferase